MSGIIIIFKPARNADTRQETSKVDGLLVWGLPIIAMEVASTSNDKLLFFIFKRNQCNFDVKRKFSNPRESIISTASQNRSSDLRWTIIVKDSWQSNRSLTSAEWLDEGSATRLSRCLSLTPWLWSLAAFARINLVLESLIIINSYWNFTDTSDITLA